MKKLALIPAVVAALSVAGKAEVTPFNLLLASGEDHTIPADKTLILIHAFNTGTGTPSGGLRVFLNGATSTQYITLVSYGHTQSTSGAHPLILEGGTRLDNQSTRGMAVIGKLVDPADLFASSGAELGDIALTASTMSVTATAATSRPVKVAAERSSDGRTWTPVPAANITRTGSDSYLITVARLAGVSQEFLRAAVTVRPSS